MQCECHRPLLSISPSRSPPPVISFSVCFYLSLFLSLLHSLRLSLCLSLSLSLPLKGQSTLSNKQRVCPCQSCNYIKACVIPGQKRLNRPLPFAPLECVCVNDVSVSVLYVSHQYFMFVCLCVLCVLCMYHTSTTCVCVSFVCARVDNLRSVSAECVGDQRCVHACAQNMNLVFVCPCGLPDVCACACASPWGVSSGSPEREREVEGGGCPGHSWDA